jgi:hypothetical protein
MGRFSTLLIQPRLLRATAAAEYVGCEGMLKLMREAGWITPIVQRHRMTLYRLADLDACCSRLDAGEFPLAVTADSRSENAFSMP